MPKTLYNMIGLCDTYVNLCIVFCDRANFFGYTKSQYPPHCTLIVNVIYE